MNQRPIRVAFQSYEGEPEEFRSFIRRDAPIPIVSASVVGGRAGRDPHCLQSLPVSALLPPALLDPRSLRSVSRNPAANA